MGVGGDGGGAEGGGVDLIEAVLTCEGNISDPQLPSKLACLVHHLRTITRSDYNWVLKRVEPWNSVRVTFSIPREAAARLHQLAEAGDATLRQLGILSVQVEGDQVISLKVAGPNNETTEILIRTDGAGPSGESMGHNSIVRSVTQAVCGANVAAPVYGQQHPQPHPMPQFRSPAILASDGVPVAVPRPAIIQQRSQGGQSFPYPGLSPLHARQLQQSVHATPTSSLAPSVTQSRPSPVVPRPVFHSNPPPPYPSQDTVVAARQPVTPIQQVSALTQINGQYCVNQSSVSNALPQSVTQHPQQITSIAQPATGGYRVSGSPVNGTSGVVVQSNRGPARTQVNMVKNSPLLVGLLQQPEQSSQVVTARCPKGVPVQNSSLSATTPSPVGASIGSPENGPLPSVISNIQTSISTAASSGGTFIGRSRDGLTTHQIFSGGSVITSAAPTLRQAAPISMPHSQPAGHSSLPPMRLQQPLDSRRVLVASSSASVTNSNALLSLSSSSGQSPVSSITSTLANNKITNCEEVAPQSSISQSSSCKKESQYLINPNTGLLEPRPNTDSSDSETECRTSPLPGDQNSVSLPSDEESNLSVASRKETDHSDSDVSRMSVNSIESRNALSQERIKSRETDSSPGSSWENSVFSSSPGEKIKLRFKLGKEQVAQTTIVGNTKKSDRKDVCLTGGPTVQNNSEPRVPKLHIKLHSSQPVIVKSVEECDNINRKLIDKDTVKDDKNKRKSTRTKPKNETDFDLLNTRNANIKLKPCKERSTSDDITPQALRIMEGSKRSFEESSRNVKSKESNESGRLKIARLLEENRLSLTKGVKVESKPRTRLKNHPVRKVGDLSSVGEIASHKILETLPPSITKVAAMHTQHPHRNPSPSPSPSFSVSPFFSAPVSLTTVVSTSSPSTATFTASSGDCLKTDIEKRRSDIVNKSDSDQCTGDSLSKMRLGSPPSYQGIMNGDLSHCEKLNFNRLHGKNPVDISRGNKLTIRLKGTEEIHSLDMLKKELPEGLGAVPTFLNSSVLINKVSSDKSSPSGHLGSHCHNDDLSKKVDGTKMPILSEVPSLKSNSDVTIHSVNKSELLTLSQVNETDHMLEMTIKQKSEVAKVGRVTCVDVTDRQALEEALKSSRNSSKKNDVSLTKTTSSMVDRLRRWNSIDSSNSVPFSSHSQQPVSESTNLYSMAVKTEPKDSGSVDNEKVITTELMSSDLGKRECCMSQQLGNVNNKNNCDSRNKDNVDISDQESILAAQDSFEITDNQKDESPVGFIKADVSSISNCNKSSSTADDAPVTSSASNTPPFGSNKMQDVSASTTLIKAEVESPEGTPKGEHGNGQGGEDSGIESMDALSEKSPNLSDQSPNRREEKEPDLYQEKGKDKDLSHSNDKLDEANQESTLKTEPKSYDVNIEPDPEPCTNCLDSVQLGPSYDTPATSDGKQSESPAFISSSLHTDEPSSAQNGMDCGSSSLLPHSKGDKCDMIVEDSSCTEATFQDGNEATSQNCQFSNKNSLPDITLRVTAENIHTNLNSVCQNRKDPVHDEVADSNSNIEVEKNRKEATQAIATSCSSLGAFASTTTTLSITSPKVSTAMSSQNVHVHNYASTTPVSHLSSNCSFEPTISSEASIVNCISSSKPAIVPMASNYKPSLLAITLSRPPGSGMTSQYAASLANNIDKTTSTAISAPPEVTLPITNAEKKALSSIENQTAVFCQNIPCNNNSLTYSNSYTTNTTNTTMIILTATTGSSTTPTSSPPNRNKPVTLKQNPVQTAPTTVTPVGKAFRLVALPGINSVAPASSPVKGQIVTLKPVITNNATSSTSKNASCPSSVPPCLSEGQSSSREPLSIEAFSPVHPTKEELDFVGFSTAAAVAAAASASGGGGGETLEICETKEEVRIECVALNIKKQNPDDDLTPLRVQPPLYTYGNRERKKDVESDVDEKDKDENKNAETSSNVANPIASDGKCSVEVESEAERKEGVPECSEIKSKNEESSLDALTIEIPTADNYPDDKRLTRSTRQSARLASPKVSSPGCELSPKLEKKSPLGPLVMSKPGIVRSSLSPALRVTKRRRHESESSNASSACEDTLLDPQPKLARRKAAADKLPIVETSSPKTRVSKVKEIDAEKVTDSSDDDSLHAAGGQEEEDDSRPSSRHGRPLSMVKTVTRAKERPSSAESRDPLSGVAIRRTPRQTKPLVAEEPSSAMEEDDEPPLLEEAKERSSSKERTEVKKIHLTHKDILKTMIKESAAKNPGFFKNKKDFDLDSETVAAAAMTTTASSRRKTRSTTNTANEDANKRRRLSKDK